MFKYFCVCLCIFLTAAVFSACGKDAADDAQMKPALKLTDSRNRHVALIKKPKRVTILSSVFFEPMRAVGADHTISIISPPFPKRNDGSIDGDKLLSDKPDLIIVDSGANEKLLPFFEKNRVPAVVVDMKTFDDVLDSIHLMGEITEHTDLANLKTDEIKKKVLKVLEKVPKVTKRVAILQNTGSGLGLKLKNSTSGSVLRILGWENVADALDPAEPDGDFALCDMTELGKLDPEIIFVVGTGSLESIKSNMDRALVENPSWQYVQAIKEDNLYYLPQDLFLECPGLRYPEAVTYMAKLIYPGNFSE